MFAMEIIIYLAGILLLGCWMLRTSFGGNALVDSQPRRNSMPALLGLVPMVVWFAVMAGAVSLTARFWPDLPVGRKVMFDNIFLCAAAITASTIIIILARRHFARRLKGFGLDVRTIGRDFPAAILNLLTAWPIVVLMFMVVMYLGNVVSGQDFKMPQHQELESITAYPQWPVRVLIFITAVVVMPVFEEMLFRGMFQTIIRSFVGGPWLSILITSVLFATIHSYPSHWPALFALSICLGYAYEKSGSLVRSIFIHSLFNAASVIATMTQ